MDKGSQKLWQKLKKKVFYQLYPLLRELGKQLFVKNYFNTYRYRGLPPTPICYPGEKAILAVLYPNKTDYLYFVSDGKGGHRFSKNFSEHKKNIKLWIKGLKNYGKN